MKSFSAKLQPTVDPSPVGYPEPTGWRQKAAQENTALGIKLTHRTMLIETVESIITLPKTRSGRVRHESGEMNGREKKYAAHLDIRKAVKEIQGWKFEPIKLRLAPKTFFDIDFMVHMIDGSIELHEVKGHWEDDARVKIKVAAAMFQEFKFVAVIWNKSTKDWKFEEFKKGETR